MSKAYTDYIITHRSNVIKAYNWLRENKIITENLDAQITMHDISKYSDEEYSAYDEYFFGKEKTEKVESDFNYAWLHHIHKNPHHWQYWVLEHDNEPEEALEMPENYVYEMICDWWSFSFKINKLDEIFSWYEKHKDMILHENTRKLVEDILEKIKKVLDNE